MRTTQVKNIQMDFQNKIFNMQNALISKNLKSWQNSCVEKFGELPNEKHLRWQRIHERHDQECTEKCDIVDEKTIIMRNGNQK